ncbi:MULTISPECIES: chitobiase/beta-hexosaminidase C-terminal domain-containing protein [Methanobacterium]|jgi:hypothetical protein|uniref:Uncharacterized protein n=1 Tax=Methanobacterium bryantii TaxID=2161 RepID=A0A2A2H6G0_METBR|nr:MULTISPECIES: chitobiase/beta-hexosaminidase C-terminal domain-containing protein [Methanobacterium]OEC85939.1 hypothetical protein A9507_12940 [Methanobacterium sp. A39]PAV04906.1 hypothetical protein ASJ80_11400 [Methanobacterium bryantii]
MTKKIICVILFILVAFSIINASYATQIGSTSYGYVDKVVYGNYSSNETVVLIVGVHPQENGIHKAIANAVKSKSASLNKRYVLYYVHVTKNVNDYSKSRMNGQLLAQKFVVPDVSNEHPMLVVDNHENHYKNSGYAYCRFLYPISGTKITKTYANQIISAMTFLRVYYPPNPTSPQYVTVPIAKKGIPTIIYETYAYDSAAKKASDANAIINALDKKVIQIPTVKASRSGGYFNTAKNVTLTMDKPGIIYYTINGSTPTITSTKYNAIITITHTTTLKYMAVDNNGHKSCVYTQTYILDQIAPKLVATYPKNNTTGISRTHPISIRFSENVLASINWSNVIVKNKYNQTCKITKWVSGNHIYIKTNSKRSKYLYYTIYIPASAVKDYAGNNFAGYTFKFKTGKY